MLDPAKPFIESVMITKPYLLARSIGGGLMTLGHLVFATHFLMALTGQGAVRRQATRFRMRRAEVQP